MAPDSVSSRPPSEGTTPSGPPPGRGQRSWQSPTGDCFHKFCGERFFNKPLAEAGARSGPSAPRRVFSALCAGYGYGHQDATAPGKSTISWASKSLTAAFGRDKTLAEISIGPPWRMGPQRPTH